MENTDKFEGNKTHILLTKIIPEWKSWSLSIQDRFIQLLEGESEVGAFVKDDEEVLKDLKRI